jgi:hypothetical protein
VLASWCLGVGEGIVGDGAGHVEDAVTACNGRRQAAEVEQVGLEQPQPLRGAVQPQQVRVLGVACMRTNRLIVIHTLSLSLSVALALAPVGNKEELTTVRCRGSYVYLSKMKLPGSRTVPWILYRPPARRRSTSHEATKPPAPVTHTVFIVVVGPSPAAASIATVGRRACFFLEIYQANLSYRYGTNLVELDRRCRL